jgi:type IV secretion system protein VirB4
VHARILVIDKDRGLEMAVRALGGSYSAIRIGEATGLNPFQTEVDERGAAWLTDWLGDILSGVRPFETAQTVSLNTAVRQIVTADPRLRTFDGLATLVAATDDEGDLVGRVREWGQGGRHGWLFGPGAASEISLAEDVVGIDMSEILDLGTERSALLAYLFRRIERVIEDRRPTLIVIDEAWKMLDDALFVKRLQDWLVTMRKKNAVVMMLTQTPTHLTQSKVGQIIAESAVTQLLYPNPRANPEDYRILRLNEKEAEFLCTPTGGLRLALLRSAGDSVFVNMDLTALGAHLAVLGGGRSGEDRAPHDWRDSPDFWRDMQ